MTNFRIKHYEYFNEEGKVINKYYYIQEWKKFLWWFYWKDIKHTECGMGDCYKTRTTFKTLEEAQQFVENVLCPELPRDKSKETEVDTINCKTIKNDKN
jgi:hypothetical protein